jgi:glycerophosphoryl diester phosphodiesterase
MTSAHTSGAGQYRARAAAGLILTAATVAGTVAAGSPAVAAENHTVIAHRGDRAGAPENTIAAFRNAINKGAEAIELDVQFSRTGYPVVIHDSTLDRTTNCSGKVSSKSVTQLHRCDAGSWFGKEFKGEEIPTLWDALKYIQRKSSSTKVILHMKVTPTREQAAITMQRVRKNHMSDRTIVMASTTTAMGRMKDAGAKKRAWIFNSRKGWDYKYQIMVPYEPAIDPEEVAAARKRGAVVWTVEDHPLSVSSLLGLAVPVQGVMLNRMTSSLIDRLNGLVDVVTTQSVAPRSSSDDHIRKSAPGSAEDEMTAPGR